MLPYQLGRPARRAVVGEGARSGRLERGVKLAGHAAIEIVLSRDGGQAVRDACPSAERGRSSVIRRARAR